MQKTKLQVRMFIATLLITLGVSISNPATLQAQEIVHTSFTEAPMYYERAGFTFRRVIIPTSPVDVQCLARNIYFEARGEPYIGMVAVAFVTKNRVHYGAWPSSVCGVVYQRDEHGCQFSWTCHGRFRRIHKDDSWRQSLDIADAVLSRRMSDDPTSNAVFYHNQTVSPGWSRSPKLVRTVQVGNHTFYKLLVTRS